jgi:hypothetical protein
MEIQSLNYAVADGSFPEKISALVDQMRRLPQTDCPVKHHFSPGLYLREIFMPAGTVVIGRIHKTEHFNILVQGSCAIVHDDFRREVLQAPMVFVSKAGVQKALYILEDMIWMTTHVSEETDLTKLEVALVEPVPLLENQS